MVMELMMMMMINYNYYAHFEPLIHRLVGRLVGRSAAILNAIREYSELRQLSHKCEQPWWPERGGLVEPNKLSSKLASYITARMMSAILNERSHLVARGGEEEKAALPGPWGLSTAVAQEFLSYFQWKHEKLSERYCKQKCFLVPAWLSSFDEKMKKWKLGGREAVFGSINCKDRSTRTRTRTTTTKGEWDYIITK